MSTTSIPVAPVHTRPAVPRRRRVFALPEVRWAVAATVAFLLGLAADLAGAPGWAWGALYAVAYICGGWEPAWAGLLALRERTLDVDLLMIVAALGAAAIGQPLDGALLIVIFATSGALEAVAAARTEDSVRGLLDLTPETACRIGANGAEEVVPVAELAVGEVVLVRPGERVGADGVVLDGSSEVDEASITGEPLPVPKHAGDEVFAATVNGTGALRVRVERDASESVIARIVAMVERASRTKAPAQLLIEKIEQRYSVGVVLATLAVFTIPLLWGEELTGALLRAMTFMIVASPCAVVLATMPPLLSAIANAGRHGVLVKSAAVMQQLGEIDTVVVDKTGTLTEGTPRLSSLRLFPGTPFAEETVLAWAAAVENNSEHPLARAVVAAARSRGLDLPAVSEFSALPGIGVTGVVEGATITIASPQHARSLNGTATALVTERQRDGETAVLVERDGHAVAVLGIVDQIREDAAEAMAGLTALTGSGPVLLTGDNARAAARVAAEVGITDVHAELLPQDKLSVVHEHAQGGRKVLAIGDGVNDAPALAAAHVGVAMGRTGSDLALKAADVVIVRDEFAAVPSVVALSRRARRVVAQNLVVAGVFIAALVLWDLIGTLPLPLGVLGHEGSTVLVGLNGLRLLREAAWRGTP